jgi:hypothetical protein
MEPQVKEESDTRGREGTRREHGKGEEQKSWNYKRLRELES